MRMVPIEQVATVNPRSSNAQLSNDESISFVPMAAVRESGELCGVIERPASEVKKGFTSFQRGDVLVAKITPCMENGKAVWTKDLPTQFGFGSTEFHVLRPGPELDPQFLFFMVWHPRFRSEAAKNMTGSAGQKRVPSHFLASYEIPLPPLAEQRRIAAILDKADALRRKAQHALDLTDDLIRSTFLDMFGDPVTNPKGWPLRKIEKLGNVVTGSTPSSKLDGMFGGNIPFITPGDLEVTAPPKRTLTDDGALESRTVRSGSTLVCCIGATIGKTDFAKTRSAFNQQINAIEWGPDIQDEYGYFVMSLTRKAVIDTAIKTTLPILKKSAFQQLDIPVPTSDVQLDFAKFSRAQRAHRQMLLSWRQEADRLFDSCLHRAFTGGL